MAREDGKRAGRMGSRVLLIQLFLNVRRVAAERTVHPGRALPALCLCKGRLGDHSSGFPVLEEIGSKIHFAFGIL